MRTRHPRPDPQHRRRTTLVHALSLGIACALGLIAAGCASTPEQRGTAPEKPVVADFYNTPASAPPRSRIESSAIGAQSSGPQSRAREPWRSEVVVQALASLDTPYRYGGTSSSGLDCSALVQRTYRTVGIDLPRTSAEQSRAVQRRVGSPEPGDILFFAIQAPQGRSTINHVAIYLGNGRFVHAPRPGARVRVEPLDNPYWRPRLQFAGHPVAPNDRIAQVSD